MKRSFSIIELSLKARLDLDSTLIKLWDTGFDTIDSPSDRLKGNDLKRAMQVLAIPTKNEIKSIAYWMSILNLNQKDFSSLLEQFGFYLGTNSRTLPSGAVSVLKKEATKRRISLEGIVAKENKEEVNQVLPTNGNKLEKLMENDVGFEWTDIGHKKEIHWLAFEDVLEIHNALVKDFINSKDPICPPGIKSENSLRSAIFRPQTSNGGELKYKTVELSAAALLHSLVHNHPFHNGNKRTAIVTMIVFLDKNSIMLTCSGIELFKFVMLLAQHRIINTSSKYRSDSEVLVIAEWINRNSRRIERGNHPLPFRKFRQILTQYGCEFETSGSGGSRINIYKEVDESRFFRAKRTKLLHTQIHYSGEGREVGVKTIGKVRSELHLDEKNGIDSAAFYSMTRTSIDEFITKYKTTLNRLSKL